MSLSEPSETAGLVGTSSRPRIPAPAIRPLYDVTLSEYHVTLSEAEGSGAVRRLHWQGGLVLHLTHTLPTPDSSPAGSK